MTEVKKDVDLSESEKEPIFRNPVYDNRLLIKCMGKKEWIVDFCKHIARIYSPGRITFSPISPNKGRGDYEYFCFINILTQGTTKKKNDADIDTKELV